MFVYLRDHGDSDTWMVKDTGSMSTARLKALRTKVFMSFYPMKSKKLSLADEDSELSPVCCRTGCFVTFLQAPQTPSSLLLFFHFLSDNLHYVLYLQRLFTYSVKCSI